MENSIKERPYFKNDEGFALKEPLGIKALAFAWMPSWWKANYNVIMGRRYLMDADYRIQTSAQMERHIATRFPQMRIGELNPILAPVLPKWINATTVASAGGEVIYSDDNFPTTVHLPAEKIDALVLPDKIEDIFPYNECIRQVEQMNKTYGTGLKPHLFKNGVSNDLVQLMGDGVLLEMMDDSERFHRLLDYSMGMWDLVMDYNFAKGSMPPVYMLLNCTAQLHGPKLYDQYFLDLDVKLIQKFYDHDCKFQLHHCGLFDTFASVYRRKIPHADMVQIGFKSDPRVALETFPEAHVEYIFCPYEVLQMTRREIRARTMGILERAKGQEHRFSIVAADLEAGVPDENIVEIYNCCKNF